MRSAPRLRAAFRESLPTAVLVGVCLTFFLGIVRLSFPEGTGLRGMMRSEESFGRGAADGPQLEAVGLSRRRAEAARLTHLVRKVKDKPADDVAWHDARAGMPLSTRHSVQTLAQSSATIRFDDETSLVLGENSLIVLRSFDGEEDGSDRQATLVVFGGELRATVGGGGPGTRLAVETPKGVARLAAATPDEPASFRVQVRDDSSASVAVFRGAADVSVGERTVRVEANQAVELDPAESASPRALAKPPVPEAPAAGTRVAFRGPAAELRFRWTRPAGADSVRFVVARDPDLADVVFDVVTAENEMSVRTLPPGDYSWSIATLRNGEAGAWAPASAVSLLRDEEAPPLRVEWPEGVVREKTCRLSGVTEPGAQVFAGDAPTRSGPDGRFEIEVELTRGANNVVVEAVDAAGNSAYQSWMIKAQY
jgi:hypothetical protein